MFTYCIENSEQKGNYRYFTEFVFLANIIAI